MELKLHHEAEGSGVDLRVLLDLSREAVEGQQCCTPYTSHMLSCEGL